MKITCQSCQAKYTLADEKVAGKTVKIKCKKCGATIVVSGSEAAATAAAAPGLVPAAMANQPLPAGDDDDGEGATRVFNEGSPPSGPEEWTVNVTDEDQRTLTATQILVEYQRGVITADTYVWKDGMGDWLPISQVPELMRIVSAVAPRPAAGGPAPRPAAGMPAAAAAPAAAPVSAAVADMPLGGMGGTMIMMEGAGSPYAGAASNPAPAAGAPAAASAAAAAAPAAARRVGKTGGVDLFAPGAQQQEAPQPLGAAAHFAAEKLVGERNENSVLFSISALTASAGAGKKGDDPFDLAGPAPKNGRAGVDDLLNLGSGLSGGPMLAPPPLLAPVVEAPPPPPPPPVAQVAAAFAPAAPAAMGMGMGAGMVPDAARPKSKTPLILAIVGAVVVLGGVGAFFGLKGGSKPESGLDATTTTAPADTTAAVAAPAPSSAPAPADKPAAAPADKPADKPADTAQPAEAPSSGPASGQANPSHGGPAVGRPAAPAGPAAPAAPAPATPAAPAAPTPAPAAPAPADNAGGGKEFDRAAAMSALSAAAGAARGCKKADGPTGTARVRITFAPSGSVQSASVDGPPFAGTSVGGCIAAAFRGAHIPAFDGAPQPVSKSVTIN